MSMYNEHGMDAPLETPKETHCYRDPSVVGCCSGLGHCDCECNTCSCPICGINPCTCVFIDELGVT